MACASISATPTAHVSDGRARVYVSLSTRRASSASSPTTTSCTGTSPATAGISRSITRAPQSRCRAPPTPAQLTTEAYTGPQGAKGRRYTASVDASSHAQFETTAKLGQREGLTIVVGFPKGLVAKPGLTQQAMWLFDDNKHLVVGGGGVLAAFLLLLARWWRVGRDPRGRAIMPQYEAPERLHAGGPAFRRPQGLRRPVFRVRPRRHRRARRHRDPPGRPHLRHQEGARRRLQRIAAPGGDAGRQPARARRRSSNSARRIASASSARAWRTANKSSNNAATTAISA